MTLPIELAGVVAQGGFEPPLAVPKTADATITLLGSRQYRIRTCDFHRVKVAL